MKNNKNKLAAISILSIIIILLLVLIGIYGIESYKPTKRVMHDAKLNKPIEFEIYEGDTTSSVLKRLQENGIINDAKYTKLYNDITDKFGFFVGKYEILPPEGEDTMSLDYILEYLCNPDNIVQDEENDTNNSSETACSDVCPVITNRPEGWSVSEFTSDVNVISFDDSLNYVNGTVVLYYSFNDCPWCYDGFPVFKDVANTYDVDWYYVDVQREERNADNDTYKELLNIFSSECDDTLYMPFAVFIKDGKIIGSNTGTVSSHQILDDKLPVINSEQKEELKQIYISLFEEIHK